MVLSGSLKEFILADVFQLLSQQRITGKLVLNSKNSEGLVFFKDGYIISAECEDDKVSSKLFHFLVDQKSVTVTTARELFTSFGDNLYQLCNAIITRGLMTREEIQSLAETTTEDVSCSLFRWKTGTYKFNSLRTVDAYVVCEIAISTENIVMEAMRRSDEWNRMVGSIQEDSIFVRSQELISANSFIADPVKSPVEYIFKKLDGISPVKELYQNSFITQYKVYESINTLLQSNRISLLSSKLSESVQAAIQKHTQGKIISKATLIFRSILISIAIILVLFLLAVAGFKNYIFQKITLNSYFDKIEVQSKYSERNLLIGRLCYKTQFGVEPLSLDELKNYFTISSDDVYNYNLRDRSHNKKSNF